MHVVCVPLVTAVSSLLLCISVTSVMFLRTCEAERRFVTFLVNLFLLIITEHQRLVLSLIPKTHLSLSNANVSQKHFVNVCVKKNIPIINSSPDVSLSSLHPNTAS